MDPYAVLSLRPGANMSQIREAFRRKIIQVHEDEDDCASSFTLDDVCKAYRLLKKKKRSIGGRKKRKGTKTRARQDRMQAQQESWVDVEEVIRGFWEEFGNGDERFRKVIVDLECIGGKWGGKGGGKRYKHLEMAGERGNPITADGFGRSSAERREKDLIREGFWDSESSRWVDSFDAAGSRGLSKAEEIGSSCNSVYAPKQYGSMRAGFEISPHDASTHQTQYRTANYRPPEFGTGSSWTGSRKVNGLPTTRSTPPRTPSRPNTFIKPSCPCGKRSSRHSCDSTRVARRVSNMYNTTDSGANAIGASGAGTDFRLPTVLVRDSDGFEMKSFRQWKIDGGQRSSTDVRLAPHFGATMELKLYTRNGRSPIQSSDLYLMRQVPGVIRASQIQAQTQLNAQLNFEARILSSMRGVGEAKPVALVAAAAFRALLEHLLPQEVERLQQMFLTASPIECLESVTQLAKQKSTITRDVASCAPPWSRNLNCQPYHHQQLLQQQTHNSAWSATENRGGSSFSRLDDGVFASNFEAQALPRGLSSPTFSNVGGSFAGTCGRPMAATNASSQWGNDLSVINNVDWSVRPSKNTSLRSLHNLSR